MRLLLDESVDSRLARYLIALGHDVTAVAIDYPAALLDSEVLSIAVSEDRVLVTNDRDFGELVFREHREHRGVILLRLRSRNVAFIQGRLQFVLRRYAHQVDGFIVVTDQRTRVR